MLCEKILGNVNDDKFSNLDIDYLDIEWHEAFKKIHKKTTKSGIEVGIRMDNEILKRGLRQDDVLFLDENKVIAVNIPECEAIVINIDKNHLNMIAKVCYEIGNKHATLFWGENENEFNTTYNEPTLLMLQKIHGVNAKVEKIKFDFAKSISSSINSHTH